MNLSDLMITAPKLKQFASKGIATVEDLLRLFPRRYADYSKITVLDCNKNADGEEIDGAFVVTIVDMSESGRSQSKVPYVRMFAKDKQTGANVSAFWFGQSLSFQTFQYIHPGDTCFVCGKATYSEQYGSWTISSPSSLMPFDESCLRIYPTYPKIKGMSAEYLDGVIYKALSLPANTFKQAVPEPYPLSIAQKHNYPALSDAIRTMHAPSSMKQLAVAKERLIFDELLKFSLQLQNAQLALSAGSQYNVRSLGLYNQVKNSLPYELTIDQVAVLDDVLYSMESGKRVHALLQGDVGSGKTIVAVLLMLAMVGSGFQCALMAPSKVLAQQHYDDIMKICEPLGVKVGYCIGLSTMKVKQKREFLANVKNGTFQIVVGTQSILSSAVEFKDLALCVTDEEQKFGVAQRASLVQKASAGVHSITMSATPIPRSLAQVVYGDSISLYTINTMPNGRIPVRTAATKKIKAAFYSAERQLKLGHQIFAVCPAVQTSENFNKASVEDVTKEYVQFFVPKGYRIATLTGKDTKAYMEQTIHDFAEGKIDILIASTVIEVGINIPNATMIVIHDAECFGLSSLHQLRGRVGRSSFPSYCVLISDKPENERIEIMTETTNGFEIAQADLRMRGAGDWVGTDQSGHTQPVELMLAYPDIYNAAKAEATEALKNGVNWPIVRDALSTNED